MEFEPLKKDPESPPPKLGFKESERKESSMIVNKWTIIIAAILIVVLLIVVIVLGALLGNQRAKNKGKSICNDHPIESQCSFFRFVCMWLQVD